MSTGQSEPEKYSIDEMMERLKQKPAEDPANGELVTREDGTQVIRVRKRKRRSHQPHKEKAVKERRARAVQIVAAVIVLGILAVAAGALFVYANSAPYRNTIVAKITASSGANVELRQFRVNPFGANADSVAFTWPQGNALKSLKLRGVAADVAITSFLGTSWHGEEILAREGELVLGLPDDAESLLAQPLPEGRLPVDFARMAVGKLTVTLGQFGDSPLTLNGAEASLYPGTTSGRPQIRLSRGELKLAEWPPFRLDRALIEFRGRLTDVIGIRLFDPDDDIGFLEFSGTVDPYSPKSDSTLKARLGSFPVATVIGEDLGRILSGRIDSREVADSNYLTFNTLESDGSNLVIAFRASLASQVQWSGLPLFTILSRSLDDPWFQNPVFTEEATGTIRRDDSSVRLSNLSFANKGRMALRGDLTLNPDQTLRGTLRIGIADAMIASAPNEDLARVFADASEGYHWADIAVSGSGMRPTDNFAQLYEAAVATGNPTPESPAPDATFEDLTRPR